MRSAEQGLATLDEGVRARRFAVAWRNSISNEIHPVGLLDADDQGFRFRYLTSVSKIAGFRPFIGFPNLDEAYDSTRLWPFFSLRAMDPRRPDFEQYLGRLGLTRSASVLDILARSGGETQGDRVSVVEAPRIGSDGSTDCVFLVRGARYATAHHSSAGVVDQLMRGDRVSLVPDSSNPVNPDTLLVVTTGGRPMGWVPDLLVPYFRAYGKGNSELTVERNNGKGAPWHLRVLVHAHGFVDPAFTVFAGPTWATNAA